MFKLFFIVESKASLVILVANVRENIRTLWASCRFHMAPAFIAEHPKCVGKITFSYNDIRPWREH